MSFRDPALQSLEQNGCEDDPARCKALPKYFNASEVEKIPGQGDDDDADDRAQYLALAAV